APGTRKSNGAPIEPLLLREGAPLLRWQGEVKISGGAATLAIADEVLFATGIGKGAALWSLSPTNRTAQKGPPVKSRAALARAMGTLAVELSTWPEENARFSVIAVTSLETLQEIRLPKAFIDVGSAEWGYALGCRDGGLYLFNASGKTLSTHRLPRRRGDEDNTRAY